MKINKLTKGVFRLSVCLTLLFFVKEAKGQVKIGNNAEEVNPYAILELESSNLGLIWPRLTNEQRDAAFSNDIPTGLTIYNTDEQCIQYWNNQQWVCSGLNDVKSYSSLADFPESANIGTFAQLKVTEQNLSLYYHDGNRWLNIYDNSGNSGSSTNTTIINASNNILTGSGVPSTTYLSELASETLYIDIITGAFYTATDNGASGGELGDGTPDEWIAIGSSGAGPRGPAGENGSDGKDGQDGQGVLIGTTSPPTVSVASPTLYVNSVTGAQYTNQGGGAWQLLPSSGINSGTLTGGTLRWDGNKWIENQALITGPTDTTIDASNDIELTAGNLISLKSTVSLEGALLDNRGWAGSAGQVLTNTGTQTIWVSASAKTNSGTVDFSTLHWNGEAWVENTALTAGATDTTIDVSNDIQLTAENAITLTATNTNIAANNDIGITAGKSISLTATTTITGGSITLNAIEGGDVSVNAAGNTNISATETLTLGAGKTIAFTTTSSIDKALLDSKGKPGENGQVLSSTGSLTTWISIAGGASIFEADTDYNATVDDGTIVALPATQLTITLPNLAPEDTGKILTIKRGNEYYLSEGTPANPLEIVPQGGTIDGASYLKLNLSYQGYTLQALAGNWVIIQKL